MVQFIRSLLIFKRVTLCVVAFYCGCTVADSRSAQEVEVTSQKLSLDYANNIAEYLGDVVIKYNGATIKCDRAEVFLTPQKSVDKQVESRGVIVEVIKFYDHVFVDSKDNKAYSDYGVFTKSNNLVVLEHNVRLKEKNGYILGSKLFYDTQKKKMKMVNSRGNKRVTAVIND